MSGVVARHNPGHIISHCYHGFEAAQHRVTATAQIRSTQANGKTAGYYGWGFQAYSPEATVRESVDMFRQAAAHEVPVGWVDCETYDDGSFQDPGPNVDWLHRAGAVYDELGIRKGLYTSPEYARSRWGNRAHELSDWLLWLAHWDQNAQLVSSYMPLYGWTTMAAKQWAVRIPGDEEIDRDVILEEFTVPQDAPQPEPGDEVARLREQVEGLRILADDVAWERMGTNLEAVEANLAAAHTNLDALKATRAEMRRIREEFLGQP